MEATNAKDTTSISTLALVEIVAKLMVNGETGLLGPPVVVTAPCPEQDLATIQVLPMEDQVARATTSILFPALLGIVQE